MTDAEGRFRERRSAHAAKREGADSGSPGGAEKGGASPAAEAETSPAGSPVPERGAGVVTPGDERRTGGRPEAARREGPPLPEGAFLDVIQYVVLRASQCLGEIPLDEGGEKHFLPREAKGYIDLLMFLQEQTRESLSHEAAGALDNVLSDLRMRYLELA